jgi:DNA repair ATPase RecN
MSSVERVSEMEVCAAEALRTTQAIGKSMTRELDRLARITQRMTDPEAVRRMYRAELQAFMREELKMARQAVRMTKEGV